MELKRLNKAISETGFTSRRGADKLIEDANNAYYKGGEWHYVLKTKLFQESKVMLKLKNKKSFLGFNN